MVPWLLHNGLVIQSTVAGYDCDGDFAHGRCIETAMVMEAGPDSAPRLGGAKIEVKGIFHHENL
jgi:hypothetical protein